MGIMQEVNIEMQNVISVVDIGMYIIYIYIYKCMKLKKFNSLFIEHRYYMIFCMILISDYICSI